MSKNDPNNLIDFASARKKVRKVQQSEAYSKPKKTHKEKSRRSFMNAKVLQWLQFGVVLVLVAVLMHTCGL